MNIFIYLFILAAKIIENALATLRLIVVANGKKWLGAFLNFAISLIWVISTGLVVVNIKDNPLKILFFCLGSFLGSYIGSMIEQKLALGSNMLFVITSKPNQIMKELQKLKYTYHSLQSDNEHILLIMVERKKRIDVLKLLKQIDKDIIIISEVARQLSLEKLVIENHPDYQ